MSVRHRILSLHALVSSDCAILNDPTDLTFQKYSERWTDIAREIPAAIVLPTTEADVQKIVHWAVESGIPFVIKGAGGSEWSTISDNGFIIDLGRYSSVTVDAQARTATVRGGITQKEVAVALAKEGLFTGKEVADACPRAPIIDLIIHSIGQRQRRGRHGIRTRWRVRHHQFPHGIRIRSDHLSPSHHSER